MTEPTRAELAWQLDWRKRIRDRIQSLGCNGVFDYLHMFPTDSYMDVATRLGADVLAGQLIHLQTDEAITKGLLRELAMDSLVRVLNDQNHKGWRIGMHWKRRTLDCAATWLNMCQTDMPVAIFTEAKRRVWNALEALSPPDGWLPESVNDPIIKAAFDKGWSEESYLV